MTELTNYQPTASTAPISADTSLTEWVQNLGAAHKIAQALCSTSFVPQHFRNKPEEAAAAILYGHEVGFSPTTSLQTLYVIGGKPAMYARPMVALVQAAGHEVWTESKTDTSVTVCGQRRGSDKTIRETWDIERAKKAGYTSNKKYQSDPQAMLYARAASDVCRQVAADVLTGIGYSVEEMQLAGKDRPTQSAPGVSVASLTQQQPATEAEVTPEPSEPDISPAPITDKTRKHLFALFGERGIPDEEQLPGINHVLGTAYESRADLTEDDARSVILHLEATGGEQ